MSGKQPVFSAIGWGYAGCSLVQEISQVTAVYEETGIMDTMLRQALALALTNQAS